MREGANPAETRSPKVLFDIRNRQVGFRHEFGSKRGGSRKQSPDNRRSQEGQLRPCRSCHPLLGPPYSSGLRFQRLSTSGLPTPTWQGHRSSMGNRRSTVELCRCRRSRVLHLSCPDQQKRTTKQAAAQGSGSFKESNAYLVPKSMSVIDCPEPPAIARATRRTPSDDRDPRGWHTPGLSPPATLHHWDRYYSGR